MNFLQNGCFLILFLEYLWKIEKGGYAVRLIYSQETDFIMFTNIAYAFLEAFFNDLTTCFKR